MYANHLQRSLIAFAIFLLTSCVAENQNPCPISTDRPGMLFGSMTVPARRLQLETGVAVSRIDSRTRNTTASSQWRYGLDDQLELRLLAPVYSWLDASSNSSDGNGFGDVEIGAKYMFAAASDGTPCASLLGTVHLPTGDDAFTTHEAAYALGVSATWPIDPGMSLTAIAALTRSPLPDGSDANSASLGALVARPLSSNVSAYVEGLWNPSLDGHSDTLFAGTGATWAISSQVQLDASIDAGLDDAAPDWIACVGFSTYW